MYASGHFMWSSSCASSPFYTSYKLRMNFAKGIRVFASNVFWYRSTISGNRFFSRTATTAQAKLVVTEGGNRLQAVWSSDSGATPSKYHAVWLPVPDLRNHLLMESHELDPHIKISEMELKDGDVKIVWSSGHEGHVNLDWLRRHCYSHHSLEERRKSSIPQLPKQVTLPQIEAKELEDEKQVLRWLKAVSEHGVCLLTGVTCTDEAGLELSKLRVVDNPSNVGYDDLKQEPHMDMTPYESQPGVLFLHCVRRDDSVEGGESIIVDLLGVVEKLRVTYPNHFDTLTRVPATYQRIHYESDFPLHMVYRSPHIHLNKHGEIVKLRWSPDLQGPLQVAEEEVEPYYEAFACLAKSIRDDQEFQVRHTLKPGQFLAMNNQRVLHGRSAFKLNGGVRQLNSFTLNIDEFKSGLQVLSAKYDPDYKPKNFFNHDFSFSAAP